jgi:hypothetical protein
MADTITRTELADLFERHTSALIAELRGSESHLQLADERPDAGVAGGGSTPSEGPDDSAGVPAVPKSPRPAPSGASVYPAGVLPSGAWQKVGELDGQTYSWPEGVEIYDPFEVWEADVATARVQIGLGRADKRATFFGRERGYWLAFEMVNGAKRRPIVVFTEADDAETSGDVVAVIKGKGDGGRSMFGPGDTLPAGYETLEVDIFRKHVTGKQAFKRMAVIARGSDRQAMCTHALLQLGLRP